MQYTTFAIVVALLPFCQAAANTTTLRNATSVDYDCNYDPLDRVDRIVQRMFGFGSSQYRKFPEKYDQLPQYCKDTFKDLSAMKDYNLRCINGTAKQATAVFAYSIKNVMKSICTRRSKRTSAFLQLAHCVNPHQKQFRRCLVKFGEKIVDSTSADVRLRFPMLCCNHYKLLNCLTAHYEPICPDQAANIAGFVQSLVANVFNFVCRSYPQGSEKCDTLPKPARVKLVKKWHTRYRPVIELWMSTEKDLENETR